MNGRIKKLIPNESDDKHCLQSCFAMINNAIFDEELTAIQAEKPTNFKEGLPTWQFKALLSFAQKGLTVKAIENFPAEEFLRDPEKAIREQYKDPGVVRTILDVSDLTQEVNFLKAALETGRFNFVQRVPTLADISYHLSNDWYCFCNVNYWLLLGDSDKYSGHFVVINELNEENIILQNPGLPPIENQKVKIVDFLKAWNYPNKDASNLYLVKK